MNNVIKNEQVLRMIEILPAILSASEKDFHIKMKSLQGVASWVQIDIMDGIFVSNTSILLESIATFRHDFMLEIHLMTAHPLNYLAACARIGAKRVIFHVESQDVPMEVILEAKRLGMEVGIALNPDTLVEMVDGLESLVDCVQCMGVEPGVQGQSFIPDVLEKITALNEKFPHNLLSVDGGVNQENIANIIRVGAQRVIVGNALVNAPNPKRAYEGLLDIVRNTLK